jgi:hypothetical protein
MADQAVPEVPDAVDPTPDPTPAPSLPPPDAPSPSPWAGSPWAGKLDEVAASGQPLTPEQVHDLWQGTVQPYVTQKEQELGAWNEVVQGLTDQEQSVATYLAVAEQMYGEEVAQHLAASFQEYINNQEPGEGAPPAGQNDWDDPESYQAWYDEQPPWIQAQEDKRIADEEDSEYASDVQQYAPDVLADGTESIFARYVVAVPDGDVQKAKALYDAEFGPIIAQAKQDPELAQRLGLGHLHAQHQPAPAEETAPTVLGAGGGAGANPASQEPGYGSMEEVYDDFFNTVKGTGPHLQQ